MIKVLTAAALLAAPFAANAVVIDFDPLEEAGNGFVSLGGTYSEDGFTISAPTLFYARQGDVRYAGSAGAHARTVNGVIEMILSAGGSAFSVASIDLSILNGNGVSPDVTFEGTLAGGGTVSQTFSVDTFGFVTKTLSGFNNITSLTWRQGPNDFNAHQFDNIVVRVAEPGTLALLGLGLFGLAAARRRS
ncbi:MAG: PEP-CTERM sorting domain-containing protein [Pseudomonadota bacterium]